jgi:lipoprotein-anchoring transpeptidase ErfK/SrfK
MRTYLRALFSSACSSKSIGSLLGTIALAAVIFPVMPTVQQQGSGVSVTIAMPPAMAGPKSEMARLKKGRQRWIEINLTTQRLIAWEGKTWVDARVISSGKRSTPTRTGVFEIQTKYRTTTMSGADYSVPDVPHAMFYDGGYAIHGAYWHNSFGTPVSHGCVNMSESGAQWLYGWAKVGTPIVIHY